MSAIELYSKGARVWLADSRTVWKPGQVVQAFDGKKLAVEPEDGSGLIEITVAAPADLPHLRNPPVLVGCNDLTALSYLHEPAVLHNLLIRFCNNNVIYTYCGIVLVAINPYKSLPIYDNDTITAYRGAAMGDLDPHIFAVAEEAYTKMERENRNQSIIVSGESGAGKTVSAKYAMRYFATVGGSRTETQIEKKVLASNPIMEAIGNAKTTRNDNSSRFGKYIQIDFSSHHEIIGANMRTYLLEKSRVVFQASNERNYHIFYQLCAASVAKNSPINLEQLELASADDYRYTNQGECPEIDDVDDAEQFKSTFTALQLLGFSEAHSEAIVRVLAAILHLGNIEFTPGGPNCDDNERSSVRSADKGLSVGSKLLGVDEEKLLIALCTKKLESMREVIVTPLNRKSASFSRDALAKHIYAKLFDWIVTQINKALVSKEKAHRFIGVLDIYGFETFETNSFEQFCINYANEKLQQQFNMHVFKLEQEEYVREQIEWSFIDFYDNQPCINLIESKLGILDLLDEECRLPKGSDASWCAKLFDKCKPSPRFEKPRLSNTSFIVKHFAGDVTYDSAGFLEKNRDTVLEDQIVLLKASSEKLVAQLFDESKTEKKEKSAAAATSKKQHRQTVGSQFRQSLGLLMDTLNATTPHYVRCIKPNDNKAAFEFDPVRAIQQLRACGVLETVRLSAAGFPSRWNYSEFLQRYGILTPRTRSKTDNINERCKRILESLIKDEDKFQFGKTKIFFRAGQVAYLEKLRADKRRECAVMIQKHARGFLQRKRYTRVIGAIRGIQRYGRGMLARRLALHLKQTKAAIRIQTAVRGFVCRSRYQKIRSRCIRLQALSRGLLARRKFVAARKEKAAILIQRMVRGFLCRRRYKRELRRVIVCQNAVRRFLARRKLKKLKVEARSVEHIKNLNKGLENKIISLQQRIEELLKEKKIIKAENETLSNQLGKITALEEELLREKKSNFELTAKLSVLDDALQAAQKEADAARNEYNTLQQTIEDKLQQYVVENTKLKEELTALGDIRTSEQDAEAVSKTTWHNERRLIENENEELRSNYQRILIDKQRLEAQLDEMAHSRGISSGQSTLTVHRRTPSTVSGSSDTPTVALDGDDASLDGGYSTIRSNKSDRSNDVTVICNPPNDSQEPLMTGDLNIILKLQHRIKELETERSYLESRVDEFESNESALGAPTTKDLMRLHELEIENAKLKEDFKKLLSASCTEKNAQVATHYEAMQDELERRREEALQLRAILANQENRPVSLPSMGDHSRYADDGELYQAFETQKTVIRQLEKEVQAAKATAKIQEDELRDQIKRLQEDNDQQQKLLVESLERTPKEQTDAIMQREITKLTSENLDLRSKLDSANDQIRKLKRQMRSLAKVVKERGDDFSNEAGVVPMVKHKTGSQVKYLGMLEYKIEDEPLVIRNLITDLKPAVATTLLPGLPAYILFMLIRHTDHINDEVKVKSLLNNVITNLRRLIRKRQNDIEYNVMWLSITVRFFNCLKQYSGEDVFQAQNTPTQNEQALRHFDLSQYRHCLEEIAVWIYQSAIKIMEDRIQALVVPAIMEHEAVPGMTSNKPRPMRSRAASVANEPESPSIDPQKALDMLLQQFNHIYKVLQSHCVEGDLISQVFKQLFYYVCALSMNNLLLRKDMCNWSRGMLVRYNLSHLEQWARDVKLLLPSSSGATSVTENGVIEPLQPIVQASQLLQARKTIDDIDTICEMCGRLTPAQIVKLLTLYTPVDEYEERISDEFLKAIRDKLQDKESTPLEDTPLLMDTKKAFPVKFSYTPSTIQLETVTVPEVLDMPFLRRL